jgi:hypothetical protein
MLGKLLQHHRRDEHRHGHRRGHGLGDGQAREIAADRLEGALVEGEGEAVIGVGGIDPDVGPAPAEQVGIGGALEDVLLEPGWKLPRSFRRRDHARFAVDRLSQVGSASRSRPPAEGGEPFAAVQPARCRIEPPETLVMRQVLAFLLPASGRPASAVG